MALSRVRGMKPERAWSAFERHAPSLIDQIQTIGPPRVRLFHFVVDAIDQRRRANPQIAYATIGHLDALLARPRIPKHYAFANVAAHLPDVAGMRFLYVDREECNPVSVRVQ